MFLIEPIKNVNNVQKAINVFYESNKKNQFANALFMYENKNIVETIQEGNGCYLVMKMTY